MPRKAVFSPLLLKVPGMVGAHRDRAGSQTQPAPVVDWKPAKEPSLIYRAQAEILISTFPLPGSV